MGKEEEQRIQAMEMWLYRRMLKVPWTERKTNEEVLAMANANREILTHIRERQLRFLGHVLRRDGIEKLVVEGKLEGRKSRGRPRNNYIYKQMKITGETSTAKFLQRAQQRRDWHDMVVNVHYG